MAVSVKDFLDAIRGRYQDEPNKVEVTGSFVETVNQESASLGESVVREIEINNPTKYKNLIVQVNVTTSLDPRPSIICSSEVYNNPDFTGVRGGTHIIEKQLYPSKIETTRNAVTFHLPTNGTSMKVYLSHDASTSIAVAHIIGGVLR